MRPAHVDPPPADYAMRVHAIDVAQGAATLIEFPCGAILVDAGGELDSEYDSNAALVSYLDAFFAVRPDLNRTLATFFVTHPHIDHDRGAAEVVRRYQVQHVVTDGLEASSGGGELAELHAWARGHGVALEQIHASAVGPEGRHDGNVDAVSCAEADPDIRVLWGEDTANDAGIVNNDSLVIRVVVGPASVLITGDLQEDGIAAMLRHYASTPQLFDVDLYIAGHHGSHNATTPALVAAMTPEVSFIEMGPESFRQEYCAHAFGHPGCVVVDMLAQATPRSRPAIDTQCGIDHEQFEPRHVDRAVYGTGWDGSLVATFATDGTLEVTMAGRS
jgi:competence protein ComEC